MCFFRNPATMAFVYAAASVVLGPLIFILGYSFTSSGGDYCDGTYYLPNGSLDPRRIAEFRHAQIFQVTGAGIMLAIGAGILLYYLIWCYRRKAPLNIMAVTAVVIMMLGYGLSIAMSGANGQSC